MLASRVYVDRKITSAGGGEHSRVIDFSTEDLEEARRLAESELTDDEQVNQVVSITVDDDHPVVS